MKQSSNPIEKALLIEADNQHGVYLYLENNQWCAYEQSAYYLAVLKLPVELKREMIGGINLVVLKAYLTVSDITDHLLPGVKLVQMADNMLKYHTNTSFEGFGNWKREMLEAFNLAS